jgi:hypothetical protein
VSTRGGVLYRSDVRLQLEAFDFIRKPALTILTRQSRSLMH